MSEIKFIDASNWQELTWLNSGGTRNKKVLQDPYGKRFYFKCSVKKKRKDGAPEEQYKYEFWNEIISYHIGSIVGLNMLRYDVAVYKDEIGCISESMLENDTEQLVDIGKFMTALNPDFKPELNNSRKKYTFLLLSDTLHIFAIHNFFCFFFETIFFDTIIGNTDRHQENWAFLTNKSKNRKTIDKEFVIALKDRISPYYNLDIEKYMELFDSNIIKFAPIYDNGSSLGRELNDTRIKDLLLKDVEIEKYIHNGKPELHFEEKKINHFKLVEQILSSLLSLSNFSEDIGVPLKQQFFKASIFLIKWDYLKIQSILDNLEKNVPKKWECHFLPQFRKEFILKLLHLRFKKLITIIHERI